LASLRGDFARRAAYRHIAMPDVEARPLVAARLMLRLLMCEYSCRDFDCALPL